MTTTIDPTIQRPTTQPAGEQATPPRRRRGVALAVGGVLALAAAGVSIVAITTDSADPAPTPAPAQVSHMSADAEERWTAEPQITSVGGSADVDLRCVSATTTADAAERCITSR